MQSPSPTLGNGTHAGWLDAADCRVTELEAVLKAGADCPRAPHAVEVARGIPVYDSAALRPVLEDPSSCRHIQAEWHQVLAEGAGVLVLSGAFDARHALDEATAQFHALIDAQRDAGPESSGSQPRGADHFARAGANDRVWNALEKLCLRAPEVFARYYGNDLLALISQAWLGPGYQMTSQINCVNPGGAAQSPHRDYHLGFCSPAQAMTYPVAVHRLSPHLTLQGAVVHGDMPIESGPTLLLPHSQKYLPGYLVAGRPDFTAFFAAHAVQLPLRDGDALFFNPALLHAAGSNRSKSVRRLANLLQVSSAFGRAMEAVDRLRMSLALYPALLDTWRAGTLGRAQARRAIACCAEGYGFPTDLDRHPPVGGLAPQNAQALFEQALQGAWPAGQFAAALADLTRAG
jgi:ectoine hydroxylase-related dioxygenase (phytanoyl-CoA dioxygenase family)